MLHHVAEQGGGTKSLIDIALMLKDEYEVLLCLPSGSRDTIELASKYGVESHEMSASIPMIGVFSGGPSLLSKNFIKGIARYRHIDSLIAELMQFNPDVIILNSLVTSIIARRIPKSVKTVCFIRETIVHSPLMSFIRETFENYIDGVAYIAEHEKRLLDIKKPNQVVLPDILEPSSIVTMHKNDARKQANLDNEKYYALYMGGTASIKGFDTVLSSIKHLDKDTCVIVLGVINERLFTVKNILFHIYNVKYVSYLIRVKMLLKSYKEDSRLLLVGYQKNISALMCASDVVIFPSSKAHQPRPCIEAGFYKKPVVISDFEATKEYFVDGYNALAFKPRNGHDLAKKIAKLKNDNDLAKRIGSNNYIMSQKEHNYSDVQKATKDFIESILNE